MTSPTSRASCITRNSVGQSNTLRRHDYTKKLSAIHKGTMETVLFPAEFVQYLLHRQHIDEHVFEKKLGYADRYFGSNIFNTLYNDGSTPLPQPLRDKLAALTHTDTDDRADFWLNTHFTAADAQDIHIDMEKDISDIIAHHAASRGHSRRPHTPAASASAVRH